MFKWHLNCFHQDAFVACIIDNNSNSNNKNGRKKKKKKKPHFVWIFINCLNIICSSVPKNCTDVQRYDGFFTIFVLHQQFDRLHLVVAVAFYSFRFVSFHFVFHSFSFSFKFKRFVRSFFFCFCYFVEINDGWCVYAHFKMHWGHIAAWIDSV